MDGWKYWKGNSKHDHKTVLWGCLYVCVGLLKALLVVLCVFSPRPLWQTSRRLKHIWSCYRGDNSLSSLVRFGQRKKHRKPRLSALPIGYFTDPLCLSASWRSTLSLLLFVSWFPLTTTDGLLFTSGFAQNQQWRKQNKTLALIFILPSPYNQEVPKCFLRLNQQMKSTDLN